MTDPNDINLEITAIELQDVLHNPDILISRLSQDQLHQLKNYIFDKLSDKDGGPTIQQFEIIGFDFEKLQGKGKFRLKFEIERQFCCSDIQSCQNDYIDFNFFYKEKTISMHATYFNWEVS